MPPEHLATLGDGWIIQLEESNDRIRGLVKVGFSSVVFQQTLFNGNHLQTSPDLNKLQINPF